MVGESVIGLAIAFCASVESICGDGKEVPSSYTVCVEAHKRCDEEMTRYIDGGIERFQFCNHALKAELLHCNPTGEKIVGEK